MLVLALVLLQAARVKDFVVVTAKSKPNTEAVTRDEKLLAKSKVRNTAGHCLIGQRRKASKGYSVSRVGKCLIARPEQTGGFFRKSVVYIYEDSERGTAGISLSKPTNYTLKDVDASQTPTYLAADPIVYNGGPVNKSAVMMLHSDDFVSSNTMFLPANIAISSDQVMIEKMFTGNWPKHFRLTTGASVWQPGQLDFEFNRNLWLEAELDLTTVFDMDQDELWGWAVEQTSKQTINRFFS